MMHGEAQHLDFLISKFSVDTLILPTSPQPHTWMRYMKQLEKNATNYAV